jgi:hypothetical protein
VTPRSKLLLAAGIGAVVTAAPAWGQERRGHITPYIEVGQVLSADLDGGDVLTYSTVSAGIDASIHTRRVEVQADYRYERRFSYDKKVGDDDIHSGLITAKARVTPAITLEAGGIATQVRSDIRGDAPANAVGNIRNKGQVYSAYAGPSVSTGVGPVKINGAYRFGYTRAESATGGTGLPADQQPLDVYSDSKVHVATASAGIKSGTVLPVGVTVSGSYTRENAGELKQRFEGKYGRGDVVLPVGGGLALQAGVGYEKIDISQRDPLLDGTGKPVVDAQGRQQVDPNGQRRLAYDFDGLFWDAGVIWRPSRRTFLEARVGKRYGSLSYTGSLSYQIGPGSGVQIGVYDSVDSFGRQLNGSVAALPSWFVTDNDAFGSNYGGCVFGTEGNAAGSCMNNVFASVPTANYRSRGVTGVLVMSRGPTHLGVGGGYSRRTFLAPNVPGYTGITVNGTSDENFYGQLFASRDIGRNATIGGNAFASLTKSDLAGADSVFGWGANSTFTRRFGKLSASAMAGIYGFEGQDDVKDTQVQGQLSLRYGF